MAVELRKVARELRLMAERLESRADKLGDPLKPELKPKMLEFALRVNRLGANEMDDAFTWETLFSSVHSSPRSRIKRQKAPDVWSNLYRALDISEKGVLMRVIRVVPSSLETIGDFRVASLEEIERANESSNRPWFGPWKERMSRSQAVFLKKAFEKTDLDTKQKVRN